MPKNVRLSLKDLLGEEYISSVCAARAFLTGESESALKKLAEEKVDLWPEAFARRQEELMALTGRRVVPPFDDRENGAPTRAYGDAQHAFAAPVGALGAFRLGEDGRLYFAGKSEHYQISLGHAFPGYRLIETARRLGIPNATHNNTRGFITRTLEKALVAAANGMSPGDPRMAELLRERRSGVLNAVINLETGSLAVEAALKMMLTRFYSLDGKQETPYEGRIPVFLVMADNAGGPTGNYHGTTVLAQTLRGLWPEYASKAESAGLYRTVPVPINDLEGFEELLRRYNRPPFKTAGFCHEIILMNYGAIRLEEDFLRGAYALCRETDTPVLCDEIQSCAWVDGLFLFRRYGLEPDFVTVGKGFPGGEYPASRVLLSRLYDSMSQFGALVTNGQEELASLAYLITMAFISANGAETDRVGKRYHEALRSLADKYGELLEGVAGDGFMSALVFRDIKAAGAFSAYLNGVLCVDASAQTYKPNCPPAVLTKLPLITSESMADRVAALMEEALVHSLKEGDVK